MTKRSMYDEMIEERIDVGFTLIALLKFYDMSRFEERMIKFFASSQTAHREKTELSIDKMEENLKVLKKEYLFLKINHPEITRRNEVRTKVIEISHYPLYHKL